MEKGGPTDGTAVRPGAADEPRVAGDPGTEGSAEGAAGAERPPGARRSLRSRLPGRGVRLPAVLAVVLLLAATGLTVRTAQLADSPAAQNRALTDTEDTDRVIGEVSDALAKVFTYAPESLDATRRDARTLLAGRAAEEYTALFARLERRVRAQRLTLTTTVVRAGVRSLDDGNARLLTFLHQTSVRDGGKPSVTAAQLSVTAELDAGHWRITRITPR